MFLVNFVQFLEHLFYRTYLNGTIRNHVQESFRIMHALHESILSTKKIATVTKRGLRWWKEISVRSLYQSAHDMQRKA